MSTKDVNTKEIREELNCVGGWRDYLPNLKGWDDEEILEMLPEEDLRFEQGEEGLGDMLLDIPYHPEEDE
jgi:hypothetical protein